MTRTGPGDGAGAARARPLFSTTFSAPSVLPLAHQQHQDVHQWYTDAIKSCRVKGPLHNSGINTCVSDRTTDAAKNRRVKGLDTLHTSSIKTCIGGMTTDAIKSRRVKGLCSPAA